MRIAILGAPDSWYVKDLQCAAQARHLVTVVPFGSLQTKYPGRSAYDPGKRCHA